MKIEKEINQIKKELEKHRERIVKLEKAIKTKEPETLIKPVDGVRKLAEKVNISEEKIKEIFDFENML